MNKEHRIEELLEAISTDEKYNDCVLELDDIREREIFSYAFRLGARMAIEIMSLNC
jgi:hypothetical protein